jgi:glutamyl-tRNA synthetase
MSAGVITRFAPSPTGYLHIGGARTALFNWLYAKHTGGKMLLRIEDTDRARSTQEAVDALKDGLTWLGLDWDGEPISQFERADRHREVAEQLIAAGKAYYCYASAEELSEMRETQKAAGQSMRYDGRWRDRDPSEAPLDIKPVVRIKAPLEGQTLVADAVQGDVRFPNADLDDFVILRSDGSPTYMHAVVVDDHDMGVTDIIRGDDHLTNAARQQIIYDAMGWEIPRMAHIPLIHGPDGAKLSKRHGALGAEAYRAMGYLPEALRNYLARLGWSHGDDEIMSTEQMIEWFDVSGINKGASRFDFQKLEALNGHYIRMASDEYLLEQVANLLPHLDGGETLAMSLLENNKQRFVAALPALKERSKTLVQLVESTYFIHASRPLHFDEKAAGALDEEARAVLADAHVTLQAIDDWNHDSISEALKGLADTKELKLGKIAQPIRAALTGRGTSPGAFDVLLILGQQESLLRIADQMTKLDN